MYKIWGVEVCDEQAVLYETWCDSFIPDNPIENIMESYSKLQQHVETCEVCRELKENYEKKKG